MTIRTLPLWFNPTNVLTALVIIILGFAVYGTTSDRINESLNRQLLQHMLDQEQSSQLAATERSKQATEERQLQINLTKDVRELLEQQGNLTQASREGLIKAINTTYYETIPNINEQFENHTQQVKEHDESLKKALPKQANITLQVDNNNKLTEILEILKSSR